MFRGSVEENVSYGDNGKGSIAKEKIEDAIRVAQASDFVLKLDGGYNYKIARGMVKDAPFLILDEATSSVDTRSEELVQQAMDKLTEGRTSFIIAHRLSTIKNADKILVMQEGNVVEQGTHEELLKKNGAYAELYNSQFQN